MVDYSELKKKFKAKNPNFGEKRRKKNLAIKKIAREYELKKAEITGGPPLFTKGPAFYVLAILLLVVIGSVIVPGILNGNLTMGKKRIERNQLLARKAMTSLSIALGRYRFHVGEYPTDEEGLQVLSFRKPDEIRRIRKIHPGWDGPYVNHIVKDPWGHDYFYARRPEVELRFFIPAGPMVVPAVQMIFFPIGLILMPLSAILHGPTIGRRANCEEWLSLPTRLRNAASRTI